MSLLLAAVLLLQEKPAPVSFQPLGHFASHTEWVSSVRVDPSGQLLASAGEDHLVYVWKLQTRKELGCLKGHSRAVTGVDWSTDASLLITASVDGSVRTWSSSTFEQKSVLAQEARAILSLCVLPDGKSIAYGTYDPDVGGVARIVDVTKGGSTATLSGHKEPVHSVASTAESNVLATGDGAGKLILWNAKTFEKLSECVVSKSALTSIAFLKKGSLVLAGSSSGDIAVVDSHLGKTVSHAVLGQSVNGVALLEDEDHIAVASGEKIVLLNPTSLEMLSELSGHGGKIVSCLQFSKTLKILVSGGYDFEVRLWSH